MTEDVQTHRLRQRLDSLMEGNRLLMSALEPEELLKGILQSTIDIFLVDGCTIGLIDDSRENLVFTQSMGGAEVARFRISLSQGIAGWVARTGEGVICNDVSSDPRFFGGVDETTGFKTNSILCAPLKKQDEVIGVIEILNTSDPEGFTEEDLELLTAFGGLAAAAITRAQAYVSVRNVNVANQQLMEDRYRWVLGPSESMQRVLRSVQAAAGANTTVLLLGESGTGKEVVARAIHRWSPRTEGPFVAVNCTALSPELLESELFGHERGAFTGAVAQKKGRFEIADGGTLFLDEIGELSPNLQVKLLRVLQDREFQRVGGTRDIPVNVRIVAATNRDLAKAMQAGVFREDLFYRLNVVSATLPPLRDRPEDIPVFIDYFLKRYCRDLKRGERHFSKEALDLLKRYHWPGNIRELQNMVERSVVLTAGPEIGVEDLPYEIRRDIDRDGSAAVLMDGIDEGLPLSAAVDAFKRLRIQNTLTKTRGNQTEAARVLGLPQSNLSRLMKRLGLR